MLKNFSNPEAKEKNQRMLQLVYGISDYYEPKVKTDTSLPFID